MESKWGGFDRWRLNKFYDVLARFTRALFQLAVVRGAMHVEGGMAVRRKRRQRRRLSLAISGLAVV